MSAKVAAAKTMEPILPIQIFPKYVNKPNIAKLKANNPLTRRPKLNNEAVKPGTTPKSLRALLVQLKSGKDAMLVNIKANANMGANIPAEPPIL